MTYCPSPTFEIPRPPVEPPLHGLLDTAYEPDLGGLSEEDRDKWMSGITFIANPSTCSDHVFPWLPSTDDPQDKHEQETSVPPETYRSFVLTYSTTCMALPGKELDARTKAAKDALIAGTGQAVESIFWGSNAGNTLAEIFPPEGSNFSLTGSTPLITGYANDSCSGILNHDPLTTGIDAVSPQQALLALTQALGNCGLGARGFIHAPVYLAEDWAQWGLAIPSDPKDPASKLMTNVRGDYIVGGSGYSGQGPDGHVLATPVDGFAWAYATGPVGVLLSEPEERETTLIDHRTNLHRIIVERTVVIAANASCLFAIYVDVS